MDFLDICMGRYYQTNTGKYYVTLPGNDPHDAPIIFDYEYADVTSKSVKQLLSNLTEYEGITTAIKTREQHPWKIGSYVILSDGKLCVITGVAEDRTNTLKESARIHAIPPGTEYVIRLTEYENPMEIA